LFGLTKQIFTFKYLPSTLKFEALISIPFTVCVSISAPAYFCIASLETLGMDVGRVARVGKRVNNCAGTVVAAPSLLYAGANKMMEKIDIAIKINRVLVLFFIF